MVASRNRKPNPSAEQTYDLSTALTKGKSKRFAREDHTHGSPGEPSDDILGLLLGTDNQIYIVARADGNYKLYLPQDIDLAADVQFGSVLTTALNTGGVDLTLTCGANKTLVLANTVYDDLPPSPIIAGKLGGAGADPSLSAFVGNIKQYTFAINDEIFGAQEITHKYKEGTDLSIHAHWATNGLEATDKDVNWEVEWAIGDGNEAFSGATVDTTGDTTIPGNTTDRTHYITNVGTIDGTNIKIGAYIIFRARRIALVGAGGNPAANPFLIAVGFHAEQDTIGSRQLFVK